jgi:transcriptional regulator with XRE-family HTH domain
MDSIQKMYLAVQIAEARTSCSFTQVKLAEILGVLPTTISRWESAYAMPSVKTLIKLSEILDAKFVIGPNPFPSGEV